MNVNYGKIQAIINEYGKYILNCIRNQYSSSLSKEQLQNIEWLLSQENVIIIEQPKKEDIEFFSKQEGINEPQYYSIDYVPSAHGGRTKEDNLIHIYPYSKSFQKCKSDEEIIETCINDIVIHEIFHYFIRPNISNENKSIKDEFGHFLTEGLVQYYAEEFAKKYRLGNPKSNYGKNVDFAKELISGFSKNMRQQDIDKCIFSFNQNQLIELSIKGSTLYNEFISNVEFHQDITNIIIEACNVLNYDLNDKNIKDFIRHFQKENNNDKLLEELSQNFEMVFKGDEENLKKFINKLHFIKSNISLKKEMKQYEERMKQYLPIEQQIKEFKKQGLNSENLKTTFGNQLNILDEVPDVLYHGSPESLDRISSKESTQQGSYVYATDNPVHALFFSIFRNSSQARAHIKEYVDENGEYKVKYEIDERIQGALDEIITDRSITIHVCDGTQFFKPQGEAYINREWCSKNSQDIVPISKIEVNVRDFFMNLEKQGLVEYSEYSKDKDWVTVIDLLAQNYPFGLGTEHGKDVERFDSMYDEFIQQNFPEQFNFSTYIRNDIKEIMQTDFKVQHPEMTIDEEKNYKLKVIRSMAHDFLTRDENGKTIGNVEKINGYLEQKQANQVQEEKGKSL